MILGAGRHQVPLIQTAIELGVEAHVCSITGDYPGIALATCFHEVDISNPQEILELDADPSAHPESCQNRG